MSEKEIVDRMMIQGGRIDALAFSDPKQYAIQHKMKEIPAAMLRIIERTADALRAAPLRVQRPATRKLSTIVASIRKAHREMQAKIVAVDYVQLIKAEGRHDTKEAEVSEISHALQEVAQDTGVCLIVLSQLNADGETKHGRVIEEDADAVLRIVQDRRKDSETYKAHRFISIDKDRHNGSGGTRVPLILDRSRLRFVRGEDQSQATETKIPRFER